MPKRTTIILDDDVYEILVKESMTRYGTMRALSRVLNELVKEAIRLRWLVKVKSILRSEKKIKINVEGFYEFRKKLSKRFEDDPGYNLFSPACWS